MNIYALTFVFILLDFITGIIKYSFLKEFSSSGLREGLFHKVGSVICIALGIAIDYTSKYLDLGIKVPIASAICTYIIFMEITSITENIGKINPAIVPSNIRKIFGKLGDEKNDENK